MKFIFEVSSSLGAGEGAIIPIGGLMANGANALASFGAMPNQLPLSPARLAHGAYQTIHREFGMTVHRLGNPHAPNLSHGARQDKHPSG